MQYYTFVVKTLLVFIRLKTHDYLLSIVTLNNFSRKQRFSARADIFALQCATLLAQLNMGLTISCWNLLILSYPTRSCKIYKAEGSRHTYA